MLNLDKIGTIKQEATLRFKTNLMYLLRVIELMFRYIFLYNNIYIEFICTQYTLFMRTIFVYIIYVSCVYFGTMFTLKMRNHDV